MSSSGTVPKILPVVGSLPLSTVIGIIVGGSVAIILCASYWLIRRLRKKDKIERARLRDVEPTGEHKELHSIIRSRIPREISRPMLGLSIIPSHPSIQSDGSIRLDSISRQTIDDLEDDPPLARVDTRRLSPTKALSRFSTGIRDSWPLANAGQMPNALHSLSRLQHHSTSTITLNQVAPPGYMIPPDPQYPSRAYSRGSKTKVLKDADRPNARARRRNDRRAVASENQLSTILRSTSERLNHRSRSHSRGKSLSRTLTSFSRSGPPPPTRWPSPTRIGNESQEVLIDKMSSTTRKSSKSTASVDSSTLEEIICTPNPRRKVARAPGMTFQKSEISPAGSSGSDDSMFTAPLPEAVMPAPLTSPSKRVCRGLNRPGSIRSDSATTSTSSLIQKGSRASVLAFGVPASRHSQASLHVPAASDPFYSGGQSNASFPSLGSFREPRPLYIRKSGPQKSLSFISPLKEMSPLQDISGNIQTPTRRDVRSSPVPPVDNPFSWSPQAMQSSRRSSPLRSDQVRKKGHKRSMTIRMSVQPSRPTSVAVVPEESEEEMSPFRFHAPSAGVRMVEPSKSPSLSPNPESQGVTNRPPSSPVFQPHIFVPPRNSVMGRTTTSPTKDLQIFSPTLPAPPPSPKRLSKQYSPTLPPVNYYAEDPAEDDIFFEARRSMDTHHKRERSMPPLFSPTAIFEEMLAFPSQKPNAPPALSPNSEIVRTLQTRNVSPNTEILQAIEGRLSPALLTPIEPSYHTEPTLPMPKSDSPISLPPPRFPIIPIPSHLTGPREFPTPQSSPTPAKSTISTRRKRAVTMKDVRANSGHEVPTPRSSPTHLPSSSSARKSRAQTLKGRRNSRRTSLHASICMLRRMNSEVSRAGSSPSPYEPSPSMTANSPLSSPMIFRSPSERHDVGLRGSTAYLMLAPPESSPGELKANVKDISAYSTLGAGKERANRVEKSKEKRDSARLLRERRKVLLAEAREKELQLQEAALVEESYEEVIVDAYPVENSETVDILKRFPMLGRSSIDGDGWSDSVVKTDSGGVSVEVRRTSSDDVKSGSGSQQLSGSDIRTKLEAVRLSTDGKTSSSNSAKQSATSTPRNSLHLKTTDSSKQNSASRPVSIDIKSQNVDVKRASAKIDPPSPGKENEVVGTPRFSDCLPRKRGSIWRDANNSSPTRPESLGLYDSDGFLRSSPTRC